MAPPDGVWSSPLLVQLCYGLCQQGNGIPLRYLH